MLRNRFLDCRLFLQNLLAFNLIKYIGAAYLIYLGIRMHFSKTVNPNQISTTKPIIFSPFTIFKQGFLTNVFNPKVALFFLYFLPQFADANSPSFSIQLLLLGLWFIFSGTIVSIAIAFFSGKMKNLLSAVPLFWKWQHKFTSVIFILLGLKTALEKK